MDADHFAKRQLEMRWREGPVQRVRIPTGGLPMIHDGEHILLFREPERYISGGQTLPPVQHTLFSLRQQQRDGFDIDREAGDLEYMHIWCPTPWTPEPSVAQIVTNPALFSRQYPPAQPPRKTSHVDMFEFSSTGDRYHLEWWLLDFAHRVKADKVYIRQDPWCFDPGFHPMKPVYSKGVTVMPMLSQVRSTTVCGFVRNDKIYPSPTW